MQSKLRELAERWQAGDFEEHECAEQLLAVLDTEGDDGAVGELIEAAKAVVDFTPEAQREKWPCHYGITTAAKCVRCSRELRLATALIHFAKGAEVGGDESCDVCHEPKGDGCACQDAYRGEHDSGDMER